MLLQILLSLAAIFSTNGQFLDKAHEKPNVIVIVADDLGFGDVGPGGATLTKTPRIDQLAKEGVVLKNFYASANTCTPSRGGLLTGRFPVRLGLAKDVARPQNNVGLSKSEITTAKVLKDQGYKTAIFGKWHLGHAKEHWPTNHGFDYFFGVPYSNDMNPFALYRMGQNIEQPVTQATLTKRYTDEALNFIETNKDNPFFAYIPYNMPHVPLFVSHEFSGKSQAGLYGDAVEEMDANIGRIIDAIDQLGLAKNTLIVFTSDNGPWWEGSSGQFRDRKGSSFDGGLRVPFIARLKGLLPEGQVCEGLAMNTDLHPTIADLAHISLTKDRLMDGVNILPMLKNCSSLSHEYLPIFDGENLAGIRTDRWKLVVRAWYRSVDAEIGHEQYYYYPGLLFDVKKDPKEQYSFTREHPIIAKKLRSKIDEMAESLKETH